jgi:hypothetical protein
MGSSPAVRRSRSGADGGRYRALRPLAVILLVLGLFWTAAWIGFDHLQPGAGQVPDGARTAPPSPPPGRLIDAVQSELIRLGRLAGPPVPQLTASLQAAIRQAEREHGLDADGLPDQELLVRLTGLEPASPSHWSMPAVEDLCALIGVIWTIGWGIFLWFVPSYRVWQCRGHDDRRGPLTESGGDPGRLSP